MLVVRPKDLSGIEVSNAMKQNLLVNVVNGQEGFVKDIPGELPVHPSHLKIQAIQSQVNQHQLAQYRGHQAQPT